MSNVHIAKESVNNTLLDALIDEVIEQIESDVKDDEITDLIVLLGRIPAKHLVEYLPTNPTTAYKSLLTNGEDD